MGHCLVLPLYWPIADSMLTQQAIEIYVNGEPFQVPAGSSVTSLLSFLNLPVDRVAVELNRMIVRRRDWDATNVGSGAQLEVVEFVGGG